MFEIIQMLRSNNVPLTAASIATTLEVTKRTVYRDISALQAMRVPIEGEAGIGYVMRRGFDLPPLMFDAEEVEAIVVALDLLGRTGDRTLLTAAKRARAKIATVLPGDSDRSLAECSLYASSWHAIPGSIVQPSLLRRAIRDETKLLLTYADSEGQTTVRTVKPVAVIYYVEVIILAAWCELRGDFRHFRIDRILACTLNGEKFLGQSEKLRSVWREKQTALM